MSDTEQLKKLDAAMDRYRDRFGWYPVFDGLSESDMASDAFIGKVNRAVDANDPDIDLTDFFPQGRNV